MPREGSTEPAAGHRRRANRAHRDRGHGRRATCLVVAAWEGPGARLEHRLTAAWCCHGDRRVRDMASCRHRSGSGHTLDDSAGRERTHRGRQHRRRTGHRPSVACDLTRRPAARLRRRTRRPDDAAHAGDAGVRRKADPGNRRRLSAILFSRRQMGGLLHRHEAQESISAGRRSGDAL
jgi:hypothetical protein